MDVFVFPDYRDSNSYQTLFYNGLREYVHLRYRPICDAILHQVTASDPSAVLFHLHWEDAVYRDANDHADAWRAARNFIANLTRFKWRGGHFVWTIHNEAPHDGLHLDVHEWLVGELSKHADAFHVHSRLAADHLSTTRALDRDRFIVTPHGNYLDFYQRWPGTQFEARRRFGLPTERRVLLLFGRIGAYKGATEAIACVAQPNLANTSLVIAGKQVDPIEQGDGGNSGAIVVLDGFIDDDEIPPLFAACDFVLAPYRRSMTSGTVVLAFSMGRPVIAPRLFQIAEIVDDGISGFLYDPDDLHDLSRILLQCEAAGASSEMVAQAESAGARLTWDSNTDSMLELYRSFR